MALFWKSSGEMNVREKMACGTYGLSATIHRAPLDGNLRNAKSREGSQTSVSAVGRMPPTEDVVFLIKWRDRRLKLELQSESA